MGSTSSCHPEGSNTVGGCDGEICIVALFRMSKGERANGLRAVGVLISICVVEIRVLSAHVGAKGGSLTE